MSWVDPRRRRRLPGLLDQSGEDVVDDVRTNEQSHGCCNTDNCAHDGSADNTDAKANQ